MSAPTPDRVRSFARDFRTYAALLAVTGAVLVVSGLLDGATLSVASLTAYDLFLVLVGNAVFLVGAYSLLRPARFGPDEVPVWVTGMLALAVLVFAVSLVVQIV
jgi:hypothetical protein